MERSGVTLITFICVLLSRISGAEVEMRVRPGDDVTLYSDCVWKSGFNTVWFRNCSHDRQPPLIVSIMDFLHGPHPHYSFVWNPSNQTHDLVVKNVSVSDLGLYYCAVREKKVTEDKTGGGVQKDVYHYGNRATRLALLEMTPSTPPVSDCRVCWKLLVSVCPVCVLLSSTCLYCIYRHTTTGSKERRKPLTGNVFQTSTHISATKTLNIISPLAPVSEMERSRVTLITFICVLLSRISGAEVEMRVRPGDDVTLYSDCVWKTGFNAVWFRNCSHDRQPPLIVSTMDFLHGPPPHYSFVWNPSNQTHDLVVKNISESDLGLYYCALQERKVMKEEKGIIFHEDVYHYGNRSTRLALLGRTDHSDL
ncbi:hypothetical protein AOLI_G00198670 [Acnodon oligacanthus]